MLTSDQLAKIKAAAEACQEAYQVVHEIRSYLKSGRPLLFNEEEFKLWCTELEKLQWWRYQCHMDCTFLVNELSELLHPKIKEPPPKEKLSLPRMDAAKLLRFLSTEEGKKWLSDRKKKN